MTTENHGGAAFPLQAYEKWTGKEIEGESGMTLRDYFAAKAMQGRLSAGCNDDGDSTYLEASMAYAMADAMIAERAK